MKRAGNEIRESCFFKMFFDFLIAEVLILHISKEAAHSPITVMAMHAVNRGEHAGDRARKIVRVAQYFSFSQFRIDEAKLEDLHRLIVVLRCWPGRNPYLMPIKSLVHWFLLKGDPWLTNRQGVARFFVRTGNELEVHRMPQLCQFVTTPSLPLLFHRSPIPSCEPL